MAEVRGHKVSLALSTLFPQTGPLTHPETYYFSEARFPGSLQDLALPAPLTLEFQECMAMPDFYVSARDSHSGPHACKASPLPTEPSPQMLTWHLHRQKSCSCKIVKTRRNLTKRKKNLSGFLSFLGGRQNLREMK